MITEKRFREIVAVLIIILILSALWFAIKKSKASSKFKYSISVGGSSWYTNNVNEENGCIAFIYQGEPMKICGNYILRTLK